MDDVEIVCELGGWHRNRHYHNSVTITLLTNQRSPAPNQSNTKEMSKLNAEIALLKNSHKYSKKTKVFSGLLFLINVCCSLPFFVIVELKPRTFRICSEA